MSEEEVSSQTHGLDTIASWGSRDMGREGRDASAAMRLPNIDRTKRMPLGLQIEFYMVC